MLSFSTGVEGAANEFPQLLQNLAPGGFCWLQLGQISGNFSPQLLQNREPDGFSCWQFVQMIKGKEPCNGQQLRDI